MAVTSDAGLGGKETGVTRRLFRSQDISCGRNWNAVREETILEDICERSHPKEAKVPETEKKPASPEEKIIGKQAPRYRTVWSSSR